MTFKPRNYQSRCLVSNEELWNEGNRSVLDVMPTGCGKTCVFALEAAKVNRTMVIAHRQELIWQAKEKIERITGLSVAVEMGEHKADMDRDMFRPKSRVVVSTVQTHIAGGDGAGRIGKFNPIDFDLLITDEAHHDITASRRRIIDYYKTNPKLKHLGVTATPNRADEEALGKVYDAVGINYLLNDPTNTEPSAIQDGWLVPVVQQVASVGSIDFSQVRVNAGELSGSDMNAVMTAEKPLHGIADGILERCGDLRGLGFAQSVEHARLLCNIFNRHRSGMAAFVCGKTDKDERQKINRDFANGKIRWLWNCGTHTEGFDDSGIEVIAMAKFTLSLPLYMQMLGRGTRTHKSIENSLGNLPDVPMLRRGMITRSVKPCILVLDFVGNSGKHKPMNVAHALAGNVSEEAVQAAMEFSKKSSKPVRMSEQLKEEEERAEKAKAAKLEEAARKSKLVGKAKVTWKTIDPFDILQVKPVVHHAWDDGKSLTEKQRGILRSAGLDPDNLEYGRAKQLIGIVLDRYATKKCTIKQAAWLKRNGYDADMSFEMARKTMDSWAKNGWQRPQHFEAPASSPIPVAAGIEDDNVPF